MRKQEPSSTRDELEHRPRPVRHLLLLMFLAAAAAGVIYLIGGKTDGTILLEKLATRLLMPVGLIWIGLFLVFYFSALYGMRFLTAMSLFCWLMVGVFASELGAGFLIHSLERPYLDVDPFSESEYDAIIVLGGGTTYPLTKRGALGCSGDRIALAAQLYHAKQTKRLICTGTDIESLSEEDTVDLGEITRGLLIRLQVSESAITTVPGRNTREEARNLHELISNDASLNGARIGLLTSAWHLPRALRLAKKAGLDVEGIPADFRSREPSNALFKFLPDADSLRNSSLALKEYLARLAGQ
jgi:uncharacterized SAM-binding protein YcdF (DUF218 family)